MIALIDGDIVAFASAASAEDEEEWVALYRADQFVENILVATGAHDYELYLTGKNNFRFQVYPEYKGNRKDGYRPKWEKQTKQHLVDNSEAVWTEGCEADDLLGVRQMELNGQGIDSIICTIDKDLNMIPGWHYRWAIIRKGVEQSPAQTYFIDEDTARHNFYYQLLVGDTTDNIKGALGIGPKKAEKILAGCCTEEEYLKACRPHFSCQEELEQNAKCLWIWRTQGGIWSDPTICEGQRPSATAMVPGSGPEDIPTPGEG